MKFVVIWLSVVTVIILGLSVFGSVPYIYSIIGISALAVIGHLVTIDDDFMGGWSNPDNSVQFWKSSLFELVVKIGVLIILFIIISVFPNIIKYGA